MKQAFEFSDNTLWLRCEDTQSDEPVLIVTHYPFFKCLETDVDHIHGREAMAQGNGVYAAYVNGQCLEFRLECGGETKPGKFAKSPVEPPKTSRQTRWYYGRWQTYFKSKGWSPAYQTPSPSLSPDNGSDGGEVPRITNKKEQRYDDNYGNTPGLGAGKVTGENLRAKVLHRT